MAELQNLWLIIGSDNICNIEINWSVINTLNCAQLANAQWEYAKILNLSFLRRHGHLLIDAIERWCWNHGVLILKRHSTLTIFMSSNRKSSKLNCVIVYNNHIIFCNVGIYLTVKIQPMDIVFVLQYDYQYMEAYKGYCTYYYCCQTYVYVYTVY